ncbi:MAG: bifunctional diaminohydroxyphosphoribosylaminopyrimidine deaminase/5-amino-6-(5-phosphoribosylamino)uracil reductase RibD [Pseudomonadota bacterium]|uniref:bifunctional diaminohydroxyphosphoribosylaminopyrimidine deaminase/5-amino-6-(5-phosphoribosylamino)uracil reductase RibD n=1 Tax=Roseovarius TaxID=74030 RepID=UPI0022A73026|nr:bifunctional diaminohydroxyphosphoribosylaminopyrimidine deaminase/5-amino-6-(5-phosphoribosylamino)uracil reductase RibD [Roseovarius sp. EGI FJ00037]MCZ0811741.1 bifunctional diaminohydroxyphosphoribosylaminopyrimidine deaminase/5-amino-6-(5-phosphoribosylamino)uracil reductase RibD [Roseovarius sp. EGI FJ00037]
MRGEDARYMALALALGRRGQGRCWPNPAVGCVIVKDGRIVGRGWTAPGGRPHAEVRALAHAAGQARGATVYVSLEPCAHHGKTPPCADALIAAGVARVVAPIADSDPRVAGQGFARLREAGIEVETGICAEAARRDLGGFLSRAGTGLPHLTLKLAMSLDGRIATASGDSQWITGPEARRMVHAMRARHDAVMVGAGTARADDPMLTVRGLGITGQPVRVVVSRRLDLPLMSQLAQSAREVPLWLCHGPDPDAALAEAWDGVGATRIACDLTGRQLDMGSVLRALGEKGITRVFCEGGGGLAASLLGAGLVDELVVFRAGIAIGAEGLPGIGALGLERLAGAERFALAETRAVGGDTLSRWRRG